MFEQKNINQELSYLETIEELFREQAIPRETFERKVNKHIESFGVISFE